MKILLVNAVYTIKSTGRSYKELQDYLRKLGHECITMYGEKKKNYQDTVYIGNYIDHKCHALMSRITGKVGCFSYFSTKNLIRFVEKYRPDIVHLGNLHGNFINIPLLLEYLAEKDIVTTITLHDCFFYTGGCMHYTSNSCFNWKTGCKNCKNFKNQGSWFLNQSEYIYQYKKNGFEKIRRLGVVGVSDWITSEAKISPILSNAKIIKRIYDWIDMELFFPDKNRLEIKKNMNLENKFVILGVASHWSKEKGLNDFLHLTKYLNDSFIIVLVGKITTEMIENEKIINIPETDNVKELVQYYNVADVFVQFSKEETFGKVVAEALACGTPSIVYESTASPELVKNGCGYSVDVKEGVEGVWKRIQEVERGGKEKFTSVCRKNALVNFEKEKNCEEYLNLWKSLIEL